MGGLDKVFADLRGRPVLGWSLLALDRNPDISTIAVCLSAANLDRGKALVSDIGAGKVTGMTTGGRRRQDSVRSGLQTLLSATPRPDFVLVHDGARPFLDDSLIGRGLEAAARHGAAVAAVPVKDTIKLVANDGIVSSTPDRGSLRSIQTPQVFRTNLLVDAHREITADVTDDASMIEAMGQRVVVFEGHPENIKITTPEDLLLAELIARRRAGEPGELAAGTPTIPVASLRNAAADVPIGRRYGTGFDGHRLATPGPLRIGGIDVPFELHLAGHSDGDVLLHAISSSLLGAAGMGDLGRHFPSSDPGLASVDSRMILQRVVSMLEGSGWKPDQVDATIIAQRPRLAEYTGRMTEVVCGVTGLSAGQVNIKVTSTDHVGAIGEGAGIAAQAIVVICHR